MERIVIKIFRNQNNSNKYYLCKVVKKEMSDLGILYVEIILYYVYYPQSGKCFYKSKNPAIAFNDDFIILDGVSEIPKTSGEAKELIEKALIAYKI